MQGSEGRFLFNFRRIFILPSIMVVLLCISTNSVLGYPPNASSPPSSFVVIWFFSDAYSHLIVALIHLCLVASAPEHRFMCQLNMSISVWKLPFQTLNPISYLDGLSCVCWLSWALHVSWVWILFQMYSLQMFNPVLSVASLLTVPFGVQKCLTLI